MILIVLIVAALAAQPASAAAPRYTGVASIAGEWHTFAECSGSSDTSWNYGGTYWPARLDDLSSLDARTRTGGGHATWADFSCTSSETETGSCSLQAVTPAGGTEHFADEDFNFSRAPGGIKVSFLGHGNIQATPGCPGGPGFGEGEGDPHGFIPAGSIGDATIRVGISGSYSHSAEGLRISGRMNGTLTLTRVDGLKADPGGPYTIRRGGTVVLDGSASTERSRIRSYRWSFREISCPRGANAKPRSGAEKTGRTARVVALCSMGVKLTVSDGQDTASNVTKITVVPRRPQRVQFKQRPRVESRTFPFFRGAFVFGFNRCAIEWEEHEDPDRADHWLHPGAAGGRAFQPKRVSDPGGPFDDHWYLAGHQLKVIRTMIVNRKLQPGGDVYEANRGPGHLDDMKSLLAATLDHERIHGELVAARLTSKKFGLPAQLERAMAPGEDALRDSARSLIRTGEGELKAASSEGKVRARMQTIWHGRASTIRLPGGGQQTFPLATAGD